MQYSFYLFLFIFSGRYECQAISCFGCMRHRTLPALERRCIRRWVISASLIHFCIKIYLVFIFICIFVYLSAHFLLGSPRAIKRLRGLMLRRIKWHDAEGVVEEKDADVRVLFLFICSCIPLCVCLFACLSLCRLAFLFAYFAACFLASLCICLLVDPSVYISISISIYVYLYLHLYLYLYLCTETKWSVCKGALSCSSA